MELPLPHGAELYACDLPVIVGIEHPEFILPDILLLVLLQDRLLRRGREGFVLRHGVHIRRDFFIQVDGSFRILAFMAKNAPIAPPIRRRAIATVAIKSIVFFVEF
jgi:hypothetical protein